MAVKSADRKPEKYIGPDGKPRIRMVPVDKEVVKSEAANASKEAQRHMQGMKDARADMKVAKSADAMTKAMNKLQHHTKAHKKAVSAMNEAAPKIDDKKYAAHMARNKKTKTMTSTQKSLSDISKRANEAKEVDEISLKDLSTTIAKSTGNKNLKKALKTDKLKADLAKMKMATEAKDPEEYDKEGDMAKTQLKTMIDAAQELHDQLSDDENMPEWVQNKITKATDYIDSVRDYMKNNDDVNEETQLDEYGGPPISRAKYLKQKPMKERELTPGELKKREKYAKDLPDAEFKKRYGDRWKSVKIATATKMAKGEK